MLTLLKHVYSTTLLLLLFILGSFQTTILHELLYICTRLESVPINMYASSHIWASLKEKERVLLVFVELFLSLLYVHQLVPTPSRVFHANFFSPFHTQLHLNIASTEKCQP